MAIKENSKEVSLGVQDKDAVLSYSTKTLPLNPTAQGISGEEIRMRQYLPSDMLYDRIVLVYQYANETEHNFVNYQHDMIDIIDDVNTSFTNVNNTLDIHKALIDTNTANIANHEARIASNTNAINLLTSDLDTYKGNTNRAIEDIQADNRSIHSDINVNENNIGVLDTRLSAHEGDNETRFREVHVKISKFVNDFSAESQDLQTQINRIRDNTRRAIVFNTFEEMIEFFSDSTFERSGNEKIVNSDKDSVCLADDIYIKDSDSADWWVSGINETPIDFTMTKKQAEKANVIQVGYVELHVDEIKYDLTPYALITDLNSNVNTINTRIDNEVETLNTTIDSKEQALNAKDTSLENAINEHIASNETSFNETNTNLNNEISRATNKENELENAINANSASIATNTSDIANANTQISTNTTDIASINTTLDSKVNTSDIDRVPTLDSTNPVSSSGVFNAMASMEADIVNGCNQYADTINSTLSGRIDTEIADRTSGDTNTLTSANAYTDNKVSDLVNGAPATLDTLKEISDFITNHESEVSSALSLNDQRYTTLSTQVNTNSADIDHLQDQVSSLSSIDTSTIESDLNSLKARVSTNETNISSNDTDIATNASNISALQTQQTTNTSNIASNTTNITALQASVSGKVNTSDLPNKNVKGAKVLMEQDTRADNQPPSYYRADEGLITEFKITSTIGVNGILPNAFCELTTFNQWHDDTGGGAVQIATQASTNIMALRYAVNETTWGNWIAIAKQGDSYTKSESDGKYIPLSDVISSQLDVNNKIPKIGSDGVMEVGEYIDFHKNGSGVDYSVRLHANSNNGADIKLPSSSGTLALTSNIPNISSKANKLSHQPIDRSGYSTSGYFLIDTNNGQVLVCYGTTGEINCGESGAQNVSFAKAFMGFPSITCQHCSQGNANGVGGSAQNRNGQSISWVSGNSYRSEVSQFVIVPGRSGSSWFHYIAIGIPY